MGGRAWLRGRPCHCERNITVADTAADERMTGVTGDRVRLHRAVCRGDARESAGRLCE